MKDNTPTVIKGSKDILAQLLASEGVSVVHSTKAETATFNVRDRVLTLPCWKDMSNELYDMLVGHEVGHALFTPYDEVREKAATHKGAWLCDAQDIGGDSHGDVAAQYINIVEDARIEKLMKQKFPGLRRDFIAGYKELKDKNFFDTENTVSELLIDRINLFFKLGVAAETDCGVRFNAAEQVFVDRIANANTFPEVLQIVKDIWDYEIEHNKPQTDQEQQYEKQNSNEGEGKEEGNQGELGHGTGYSRHAKMPQAPTTQQNFVNKSKELIDTDVETCKYLRMPKINIKNIVITAKEISFLLEDYANRQVLSRDNPNPGKKIVDEWKAFSLAEAKKFIQSSKKSIAIMTKQFEMKKAADAHKRTLSNKTGVLDCLKMMKYKFDEDIFSRNVTIRTGKNHGVVMFVDWSSSMSDCINDTIEQCFLIALFCKKCNIPFEVYAFSSHSIRESMVTGKDDDDYNVLPGANIFESFTFADTLTDKESDIDDIYLSNFSLLNFASSSMSMNDLTYALASMMQIVSHMRRCRPPYASSYYMYINPLLHLGGTPLNECIYVATTLVNELKKKAGVQIMNSIFLTDGQAGSFYNGGYNNKTYITMPDTKKTYDMRKLNASTQTNALLDIHARETQSNVIGFYIVNGKVSVDFVSSFLKMECVEVTRYYGRRYMKPDAAVDARVENLKSSFKKEGFFVAEKGAHSNGYKEMYIVRGSSMILDTEDELEKIGVGSTIAKVRTAFRNKMQDGAVSKNLLNKFIAQISI